MGHFPAEAFQMLTRKGVYPYSYMDSWAKFELGLPPKESFFSDLTKSHISDDDFQFIHTLWNTFGLKNMGELHDLYMETDVLLLADIFENFREFSMTNYGPSPFHNCPWLELGSCSQVY